MVAVDIIYDLNNNKKLSYEIMCVSILYEKKNKNKIGKRQKKLKKKKAIVIKDRYRKMPKKYINKKHKKQQKAKIIKTR